MSLDLEAFRAAKVGPGSPCSVARILSTLDPADRTVLEDALADETIGHSAIERVLAANNMKPGSGQVGKHRRGACRCGG